MSETGPEILFEARGAVGLVTLNKPRALNALSLSMIEALSQRLATWAGDERISAVLIRGAGDRAFCAGGDIRELYDRRGTDFGRKYYSTEYRLDIAIHRYPKPYIALMDGVTMGGGAGISVHGTYRIVCECTVFAMPETGIGLFPDVGASWFLHRCPGRIGLYLALTGYRMRAADTLHAGIGDVFVAADRHAPLIDALCQAGPLDRTRIDSILNDFAQEAGDPPLAAHRAAIDRCFAAPSVEAILGALAHEATPWAREQAAAIARMSPTSLKVAFRQLAEGARLRRIEDAMAMEFRLAAHFYEAHDFFEGTRALIIDKDGAPHWHPARLEDVAARDIDAYFAPVVGEPDFGQPAQQD